MGYLTYWDNFSDIKVKDIDALLVALSKYPELKGILKFDSYVENNKAVWYLSFMDDQGETCFEHTNVEDMVSHYLKDISKYLEDYSILVWDSYSLYEDGYFYRLINKNGKLVCKKLKVVETKEECD